jgi:hypothetical protein
MCSIMTALLVSILLCVHCNRSQQKALQEKKKGDREKADKLKKTVIAPETNEDRVARLQQLPIKLAVDQDTSKSVPVGVLMKVYTSAVVRYETVIL